MGDARGTRQLGLLFALSYASALFFAALSRKANHSFLHSIVGCPSPVHDHAILLPATSLNCQ